MSLKTIKYDCSKVHNCQIKIIVKITGTQSDYMQYEET